MDFLPREQILRELQHASSEYMEKYNLNDIGIFEEEGQDDQYHLGYTVKKGDKAFHIHTPFVKNDHGELAPASKAWVLESDDPQGDDSGGYPDLESVLREI
jgi:hypothetical protein